MTDTVPTPEKAVRRLLEVLEECPQSPCAECCNFIDEALRTQREALPEDILLMLRGLSNEVLAWEHWDVGLAEVGGWTNTKILLEKANAVRSYLGSIGER